MAKKVITEVRPTNRGIRIWQEGKNLTDFGFTRYRRYTRTYKDGVITMKIDADGSLKVAGRERAGREIPIIDISSSSIEGFVAGQEITITYSQDKIVIK